MKKILSLLAIMGLSTTSTIIVVSCSNAKVIEVSNESKITKDNGWVTLTIKLKADKKEKEALKAESVKDAENSVLKIEASVPKSTNNKKEFTIKVGLKSGKLPKISITEEVAIKLENKKLGSVFIEISKGEEIVLSSLSDLNISLVVRTTKEVAKSEIITAIKNLAKNAQKKQII